MSAAFLLCPLRIPYPLRMEPNDDADLRPIPTANTAGKPTSPKPLALDGTDAQPVAGEPSLDEQATVDEWSVLVEAREATDQEAVVDAVRRIENRHTGLGVQLFVTFGSLILFLGLGVTWWNLNLLWMLVAILFFHEAGHYIAMRVFGYRNVTLFFIPLLGAAVSGQHWTVAGWKKALVYLAGPVPGIVLSVPLIHWSLETQRDSLFEFGCFMLILNVLNLLPLMPLDGGRLMHLTLFGRVPLLDLGARLVALACVIVLVVWSESYILLWIAFPVVLSLPMAYRIASLVEKLRPTANWDTGSESISSDAILRIDHAIKQSNPSASKPAQRAPLVLQVYDGLASKAPGLIASIVIWMIYAGALIGGLGGGVAVLARHGLGRIALHDRMFEGEPRSILVPNTRPSIHLGEAPVHTTELALLIAKNDETLDRAWSRLSEEARLAYSHVDLGTLRLVSIAGVAEPPMPTNASRLAYQRYVQATSRVRDPAETFLAPIVDLKNNEHESIQIWMLSTMWLDSVAIHATAPDRLTAQSVLEAFFQEPSGFSHSKYIPAWSPLDTPSEQQLANRAVIASMLEGIYGTEDELWKQRLAELQDKQSTVYRDEGYSAESSALLSTAMEGLRREYLQSIREATSGTQRELADAYLRYADALQQYHHTLNQIGRENQAAPERAGALIENLERPDLDDYLAEYQSDLAISNPAQAHHRFAVFASGQPWASYYDDMSPEPEGVEASPETRIVISLHDADDIAIAIGGLMAFLQEQGFHDLALHFSMPPT
ncbi:MAG: site-2 protease family protein [Planctomycetota bacterium]